MWDYYNVCTDADIVLILDSLINHSHNSHVQRRDAINMQFEFVVNKACIKWERHPKLNSVWTSRIEAWMKHFSVITGQVTFCF